MINFLTIIPVRKILRELKEKMLIWSDIIKFFKNYFSLKVS